MHLFPSPIHTQYTIMAKLKQNFTNAYKSIRKEKLKCHIDTSTRTLYWVFSWSTIGSDYSIESSLVWRDKLCTPGFGDFLLLFSAHPFKLLQVGWELSMDCHFQVSPEMTGNEFKSGLWLSPQRTFTESSLSYSCTVWLCVYGHCPVERWTFGPDWGPECSVLGLYYGYLCAMHLSALPRPPVTATEKHPQSTMLPPPCFNAGMVLGRWWVVLGFLQTWGL